MIAALSGMGILFLALIGTPLFVVMGLTGNGGLHFCPN